MWQCKTSTLENYLVRVSLYLLYTWGATELQFMKFHKPHCKYWLTSQVIWYTCYNEFSKWIILFREHFYNSVLHHSSIPYGIMVQTGEQGYFNAFILYALQRHVEQQWWVGWKSLLMDQPLLMIKPSSMGWRHPVWTEISMLASPANKMSQELYSLPHHWENQRG